MVSLSSDRDTGTLASTNDSNDDEDALDDRSGREPVATTATATVDPYAYTTRDMDTSSGFFFPGNVVVLNAFNGPLPSPT
jgi:hypothetical protein